jgi:signal peptidase I
VSGKRADRKARRDQRAEASSGGGLWEQVSTLFFAVLIALGIRAFVIEPYRIPSGSMFPTLLIGDHLFVNKFIYGITVPFSDLRLPGLREPGRGDVVVFTVAKLGGQTFPADRRPDLPREEFVKRIVGLPGDRVEFRYDDVYINGERVEVRPIPEEFRDDAGRNLVQNEVTLGDHTFRILDDPMVKLAPPEPMVVEPGRYLMLGDNRDHSKDSRFWGSVRLAEIKGPAFILYWSWDFNGGWGELLNPLTWWELLTQKMRWGRIGGGVP